MEIELSHSSVHTLAFSLCFALLLLLEQIGYAQSLSAALSQVEEERECTRRRGGGERLGGRRETNLPCGGNFAGEVRRGERVESEGRRIKKRKFKYM